jgi:hypothetical protein
MKEELMKNKEVEEEIEWEDKCGVNTLLQNLVHFNELNQKVKVYRTIDDKGISQGYVIRDAKTHKDVQL